MTHRSAAIAAAYMLAVTNGVAIVRGDRAYSPADYLLPAGSFHDAERIAKAEAKRARKAAKRAKQLENRNAPQR